MTTDRTVHIERELHIEARPEIVFAFFTDATHFLRWQGIEANLDPTPGGEYRVLLNNQGDRIAGRFIEVVPHSRVVYTWGWEQGGVAAVPAASTTVEVTLEPEGAGTRLRMVHRGLPDVPEVTGSHLDGWSYYLLRLAKVIAGHELDAAANDEDMRNIQGAAAQFDARFGTPH
jgi:uncharacterized protein YndB with AHSA1/START domain